MTNTPALTPVSLNARLRALGRLPNHLVLSELEQLNRQQHRLEAELLLFLGELDQRQLYREHAVASAFEFCVTRLGYSEDVAFKRVGAARLMRRFPRVYELLVAGRIHLTALMLIKPHLTDANHEDWLSIACGRSKRQVEKIVAARCPRPDVPASIRKLPEASVRSLPMNALEANALAASKSTAVALAASSSTKSILSTDQTGALPSLVDSSATGASDSSLAEANPEASTNTSSATAPVAAAFVATAEVATPALAWAASPGMEPTGSTLIGSASAKNAAATARIAPLSSNTYRVTFTASAVLMQKLDRAGELLSHCVSPTDLPGLFERALDALLEREEKRRFGVRGPKRGQATRPTARAMSIEDSSNQGRRSMRPDDELEHESCHNASASCGVAQDPDPAGTPRVGVTRETRESDNREPEVAQKGCQSDDRNTETVRKRCHTDNLATEIAPKRRRPALVIARAVFERDAGQCTYVDHQGRRCAQRHYLEFDHIDAHAVGGAETVQNLRTRCRSHNQLAAEQLFGRGRVKSAIMHKREGRSV